MSETVFFCTTEAAKRSFGNEHTIEETHIRHFSEKKSLRDFSNWLRDIEQLEKEKRQTQNVIIRDPKYWTS